MIKIDRENWKNDSSPSNWGRGEVGWIIRINYAQTGRVQELIWKGMSELLSLVVKEWLDCHFEAILQLSSVELRTLVNGVICHKMEHL